MLRVLVIDDNAQDRFLVERELQRVFADFQCQHIIDEKQFTQALDADQFDLVITDFQFGWGDGLAVLHRIKSTHPDKPVIMFTGTGNEEVAVEAMKAGLDDYVIKSPKHYIRLVAAVRTALEKAEARRLAARAEAERQELLKREQAARAEAERLLRESKEAERRKDEFLAMLAHELRNPLSPIVNAIHLLTNPRVRGPSAEQVREMLQRQVRHLSRLVDDLLDVSRITRGKIPLRRERIDLAQLVRSTVEDYRSLIERSGLTLTLDAGNKPIGIMGDPTRLAQALGNLLQNSAKFTDPGGMVAVSLAVDRQLQCAVVRVEDTGIGIEPEMLPRVFETFVQADRSLDRSKGGLGLGLALVKGLVQLHGGRVSAASEGAGRGAVLTFWLPLSAGEITPVPEAVADVLSGPHRTGHYALGVVIPPGGTLARGAHCRSGLRHGRFSEKPKRYSTGGADRQHPPGQPLTRDVPARAGLVLARGGRGIDVRITRLGSRRRPRLRDLDQYVQRSQDPFSPLGKR